MTVANDIWGIAITSLLVLGLVWAWLWQERRKARQNPETTGTLQKQLYGLDKRMERIDQDVEGIKHRLKDTPTKADVERMTAMAMANREDIKRIAESLPDIEARQRAQYDVIKTLSSEQAAQGTAIAHTCKQVDRMYDVLVPKGMKR